ncbi:hypothetical protein J2T17_000158 [Paenibacillus mucilaginosus]|uniref:hypothetical protein n=1 Tax=Paenibacillus mucilaginosus TaxID=61624 RepID=UPI003D1C9A10
MADAKKRTGREPLFDTDRAWERFEQMAAREPVPAFWKQAEEGLRSEETKNEGALEMKKTETFLTAPMPVIVKAPKPSTATANIGSEGAWRTENPSQRRLRRLTAGAVAAVLAIGLITTPLGDRALAALLQTFRIQHMVGVGISADDMTAISELLDHGSPDGERSFKLAQYGSLYQSGGGESRTVTWEEAERLMGATLLQLGDSTSPVYQPATTLTFHLNVKAVNRLLTRLGSTTTLPDEADGKAIRLHIPSGITAEGTLSGKPVRLLQFGKPELTVQDGIDASAVREAILGLPVLPDSLRTKLAAIRDWRGTLPVPVKDGVSTSLRLGGNDAVMTVDGRNRFLIWLDGDRMGFLSGNTKDFPTESSFIMTAEELIQP